MSGVGRYVGQAFRGIAVVGVLAAMAGFLSLVAGALEAASRQGVQTYVDLQLTEAEARKLIVGGFAALVGGMILNLLGNTVASFVEGFTQTARATQGGAGGQGVPTAELYRQRLERVYLVNTGVLVSLVGVAVLGSSVFGVVGTFAKLIVVVLFGGLGTGVLVAGIMAALWYGVTQRATEALIGGFGFAVVFLLYAVLATSAGFFIFALFLGYYSLVARGATSFRYVTAGDVPGGIGKHFE